VQCTIWPNWPSRFGFGIVNFDLNKDFIYKYVNIVFKVKNWGEIISYDLLLDQNNVAKKRKEFTEATKTRLIKSFYKRETKKSITKRKKRHKADSVYWMERKFKRRDLGGLI